eukprot:749910-Hanusia_phi.AAC.2
MRGTKSRGDEGSNEKRCAREDGAWRMREKRREEKRSEQNRSEEDQEQEVILTNKIEDNK